MDLRTRSRGRLTVLAAAALLYGCGAPRDAAIPVDHAETVASARRSLQANSDGHPLVTFVFERLRCREDGGLMVVFVQHGIGGREGYAITMGGPDRVDNASWSGGFGIDDLASDPEVRHFFSESPEVACGT